MIALIASALLGLYIFLPDFLFNRFAAPYVRLKKLERSKIEDIAAGVTVALIPFLFTLVLTKFSWFFGHWPWPIDEPASAKATDYRIVLSGLYSDSYFNAHYSEFWNSLSHVRVHQARFLFWNYVFLAIEIAFVVATTIFFGSLHRYWIYRITIGKSLLRRASHWHVLLTPFLFPWRQKPRVMVDVFTTDNHLYDGEVADFFVDAKGELSGLLLKQFRRFRRAHFEADRQRDPTVKSSAYWTSIPGANFVIPYDKVANINIRYVFATDALVQSVRTVLADLNVKASEVGFVLMPYHPKSPVPAVPEPGKPSPPQGDSLSK